MKKKMANALIHAVIKDEVALVKQFIEGGADVNGADRRGSTALSYAAGEGLVECTKVLLEANADVEQADRDGLTPLYTASLNGRAKCVKVRWCDIFFRKNNLTLFVVQLLIDWKANVNSKDHACQSPLHLGVIRGRLACIEV